MIKGNRESLREVYKERLCGGQPQVIVEASLLNLPVVELVVRNASGGGKEIIFDFSGPQRIILALSSPTCVIYRERISFLGPGEKG